MDQFRAGRRPHTAAVTVTTVVVAQLLAVTISLLGLWAGLPLWAAAVVAAIPCAAMFVRVGGRLPVSWAEAAWHYVLGRSPDMGRGKDFHAPGETVGLHWVDGQVLAVVELLPPSRSWTRMTRETCESPEQLPLAALAGCLEQNDVTLSGIDVVSHGSRAVAGTPAADVYDALVGPLPAAAQRIVWVVLRFDASANEASVARRGGGVDGASRTLAVAARRVIRALADAGYRSRVLSAAEIESACARICRGVHPDTMGQEWDHVPLAGVQNVGNAVDPRHLSQELLTGVWSAPSLGTTVAVRLRPATGPGTVQVGAAFRRSVRAAPERLQIPGLISAQGRHRDALLAHLPASSANLDDLTPMSAVTPEQLDALRLPVAGCGQLVGSDAHGHALTVRITGPGVTNVYVAGELYLAQQLVFRAVATGARVLVRTDRPHAWRMLVESVATPMRLRTAHESSRSETGFDTIVVDGVPVPPARAGVTTVHVHSDPRMWPPSAPDVAIVQPGASGDRVVLTVGDQRVDLALVTIASETAFIGRQVGPSARLAAVR
ncbi:type VII secretion protein EccE [Prescottella agglutinans]|uniref:Type VII secretion protein EccE n=1 Tax=Prescottella agglutinans TaxID=1644129 RepID=A0ABT6M4F4_9NOCA|nr:type VII secretion protein EccE [Prescottella agglutinans]MDH6279182.1 type VII secretion protein EccE [Prescottella agglutinans]